MTFNNGYSGVQPLDVALHLKRTFTPNETQLVTVLITQIEEELCMRTNRQFDFISEYTEKYDAPKSFIYPKNYPINNIVSLKINDVTQDLTQTKIFVYDFYIKFKNTLYSLEENEQAIELTYKIAKFWGNDVKKMIIRWVGYEFLNSENAGVALENMSFSEVSQNYDLKNFLYERDQLIGKYRINAC